MPKRKSNLGKYSRSSKYRILKSLESSSDESDGDSTTTIDSDSEDDNLQDHNSSVTISKYFADILLRVNINAILDYLSNLIFSVFMKKSSNFECRVDMIS